MPANPFVMVRGLNCQHVHELAAEYDRLYASTRTEIYRERAIFVRNLLPLCPSENVSTRESAESIKARVRHMVEQRYPLVR